MIHLLNLLIDSENCLAWKDRFRFLCPASTIPLSVVLSTIIYNENEIFNFFLVSYKPLFHTTIPYILTYKILKRAEKLKKWRKVKLELP